MNVIATTAQKDNPASATLQNNQEVPFKVKAGGTAILFGAGSLAYKTISTIFNSSPELAGVGNLGLVYFFMRQYGEGLILQSFKDLSLGIVGHENSAQRKEFLSQAEKSESYYDSFKCHAKAIFGTDALSNRVVNITFGLLGGLVGLAAPLFVIYRSHENILGTQDQGLRDFYQGQMADLGCLEQA